jgi:hypothetical protein
MLVMGYFCVGANSKWGREHPDLSYGSPAAPHIPFTDEYLDYLGKSMEDAIRKTGLDGYMIDWVWNPGRTLRTNGWLPAEKKLYTQLTGTPFLQTGGPPSEHMLAYERLAIERCWQHIRQSRDSASRDCRLWLSVSNMAEPSIRESRMLRECDWVMNEAPTAELFEQGRRMVGKNTRMIQDVVGWATHDAKAFFSDPTKAKLDVYGFAEPRENSLPLPVSEYLSKPVAAFQGKDRRSANDRNIAAVARFYRGMRLDAVTPSG